MRNNPLPLIPLLWIAGGGTGAFLLNNYMKKNQDTGVTGILKAMIVGAPYLVSGYFGYKASQELPDPYAKYGKVASGTLAVIGTIQMARDLTVAIETPENTFITPISETQEKNSNLQNTIKIIKLIDPSENEKTISYISTPIRIKINNQSNSKTIFYNIQTRMHGDDRIAVLATGKVVIPYGDSIPINESVSILYSNEYGITDVIGAPLPIPKAFIITIAIYDNEEMTRLIDKVSITKLVDPVGLF